MRRCCACSSLCRPAGLRMSKAPIHTQPGVGTAQYTRAGRGGVWPGPRRGAAGPLNLMSAAASCSCFGFAVRLPPLLSVPMMTVVRETRVRTVFYWPYWSSASAAGGHRGTCWLRGIACSCGRPRHGRSHVPALEVCLVSSLSELPLFARQAGSPGGGGGGGGIFCSPVGVGVRFTAPRWGWGRELLLPGGGGGGIYCPPVGVGVEFTDPRWGQLSKILPQLLPGSPGPRVPRIPGCGP
jgi:hypothetical protein